ncbi:hypothetical protein IEO21_06280 [Rhodonia placenta]|uniref:FAD/NAD(P)-binding domain-containing protein n=1 Tax=Rhodonia placenta TaxID=104341 RepID=A0A8H7P0S8_9APHY|nr:hypothetical protein IEO21_06280 [Postia placenta]
MGTTPSHRRLRSGGLAALKTLLDLPEETRAGWEIVLFEQRRSVGGVWLPDPPGAPTGPPELPETPLYPLLHVNTPHPTMTYPNFTFPPGTALFPGWAALQQYHEDFAVHYNLTPHIRLNHTVVSANWHSHPPEGDWHVEVHAHLGGAEDEYVLRRTFDHLIVANGHNHYPCVPAWNGTEEWLANTPLGRPQREILHSIYYREPQKYAGQNVVIVGAGASGRDIALQVSPLARVAYQSISDDKDTTPGAQVIRKPRISHFTSDAIVFADGTTLSDIDTVLLGTGYENRVPFLSAPHASTLHTDPAPTVNSSTARALTNNLHYIFPLHKHIFSLAPELPPTALAFVGLPVLIANCPSDNAQGMLIAHALANASLLPPREDMLAELLAREDSLRGRGYDPYLIGHRLLDGDTEAQDYQDGLVEFLKKRGVLPDDGKKYVEPWRRTARPASMLLARAWKRVEVLGEQSRWLEGVQTEDEWADLMARMADWQREWEEEHGEAAVALDFHVE